ncbi:IS110 family transposase [Glutamicibacter endophyticus]|uniref:IS110 family transposase n=1 Tax=Glutamicibacter endophyticus TaxID=1522174 RepID=UPI003AF0D636
MSTKLWVGIDAGKSHHHAVAIDTDGRQLLSRKLVNDEGPILELIADVHALTEDPEILWATDLNQGPSSLLLALLAAHVQQVLYIPGRTVHAAAKAYQGGNKTDAKDAAIIADQARMRRDLHPVKITDETAAGLKILTGQRADLVADRTRAINRLRGLLSEYFPALEVAFDFAQRKTALLLLTRYQSPAVIRASGETRITKWLSSNGGIRGAAVAHDAVAAAHRQHTTIPGEQTAVSAIKRLAEQVLELYREVEAMDQQIRVLLNQHAYAPLLLSIPGIGFLLAAEFIGATGGEIKNFQNANRLAGIAGVAPVSKDSGRITGNRHRPHRYDRKLLRVCFIAAQTAARICPVAGAYYARKRAEGKNHKQAVLALARRRVNVIWAVLSSGQPFDPTHRSSALKTV